MTNILYYFPNRARLLGKSRNSGNFNQQHIMHFEKMFDHGFQKLKTRNIWPWVMRRLERVSKERMFLKSTLEMIAMTVTVQLFLAFAIAMFAHKRDGVGYAMIPIYLYFTCWAFLDNYPTIVGYRSRKEIQGD